MKPCGPMKPTGRGPEWDPFKTRDSGKYPEYPGKWRMRKSGGQTR